MERVRYTRLRAIQALIDGRLIGRNPTPPSLRRGRFCGFFNHIARARHSGAAAARRERQRDEACEPNHMAVQWLTVRRLPNRPITNLPAELFRPTHYSADYS